MRYVFITGLLFVVFSASPGEGTGFHELSAEYDISSSSLSGSGVSASLREENMRIYNLDLKSGYTHVFGRGENIVSGAISYGRREIFYERGRNIGRDLQRLHAFNIGLTWMKMRSPSRSWAVFLNTGVAADFEKAPGVADLDLLGGATYNFVSGQRTFSVGAVLSRALGKPIPLPFIQYKWSSPGQRWRLLVAPPFAIEVWHKMSDRAELGVFSGLRGGGYQIGAIKAVEEVRYREAVVGPALALQIAEALQLRIDAGLILARRFEVEQQGRDLKGEMTNSGYLRVRLHWKQRP